jgi:hypothetical protein
MIKKKGVTPCGIWPQQDLRVRFSYLEGGRKAIKEAEGLHLGLLSSRDGRSVGQVWLVGGLGR